MPFFSDIGDACSTLLGDKTWFREARKAKVVAKSAGGVKYTFENNAAKSSAALSFKHKASGVNFKKVKMDNGGTITVESEMAKVADNVDAYSKIVILKGGANTDKKEENGQLGIKYNDGSVAADVNVDFLCKNSATVNASGVASYEGFFAGISARYNTGIANVDNKKWDVADQTIELGAGYSQSDFEFSSKYEMASDKLTNEYHQVLADSTKVAGNVVVDNLRGKQTFSLACGASYKLDGDTTLTGKLGSDSNLSVGYKQALNSKATVNVVSSFNANTLDDHKINFSLDLNL